MARRLLFVVALVTAARANEGVILLHGLARTSQSME
jgi:hypothetical protein